jgi:hypothetical protein
MAGHVMAFNGGKTLTIYVAADLKKFNSGLNQASNGLTSFSMSLKNLLGPALIGAGAALGAFATQMAVEGVKAAIEDEAALKKLATTLDNLGLAHDQPMVENFIGTLERATGIADDELRPAYDRLIRSIGDTATANDMLKLSMDISAGTGKSLQAVTEALGKAYDGNFVGLTRLGAGIDNAVIKTGDMKQITAALSATFAGQAATSAATYEGQVKRLSQAADNMKEAFGRGLLEGLGNTNDSTQNLVDTMAGLEKGIGDLSRGAGILIGDLADLVNFTDDNAKASDDATEEQNALTTSVRLYAAQVGLLIPLVRPLTNSYIDQGIAAGEAAILVNSLYDSTIALAKANYYAANAAGTSKKELIASAYDSGIAHKVEAEYIARMTKLLGHAPGVINADTEATDKNTGSKGSNARATDSLTKAEEKLQEQFGKRSNAMTETATALDNEIQLLHQARQAVDDYVASTAKSLNTVDLGSIFGGAIGEDGKLIAGDFITGFNTAVDQAPWFGNVLNALKQRGVEQTLIDELTTLGPKIGGGIGQAMLDDPGGLLATLNSKWVTVQDTMKTLAMGLVPEGLLAGEATAIATVDGLQMQLSKETDRLNKLGKNIGKAVGVSFKAQLLTDIAEAVAQVEATGTAARAERTAQAARQQVALTNAQIAQALQNTLVTADARNGLPSRPIFT